MQLPIFSTVSPDDGVERTVLSEAHELMVVSFRFKTGSADKLHSHPHVQSAYVVSGSPAFPVTARLTTCRKTIA